MTDARPLALLTCEALANGQRDDLPFLDALRDAGFAPTPIPWDAPIEDFAAFSLVLIRTPWDYPERIDAFLARLAELADQAILLNPLELCRWNLHKGYLRELGDAGVPIVPTTWLSRGQSPDLSMLDALNAGDLVLKPCVGAGGRETLRLSWPAQRDEAASWLSRLLPDEDLMVQPFVPSVVDRGEASLVYFDGAFSHALIKTPAKGDFRVQEEFNGTDVTWAPDRATLALAERALAAMPQRALYARVDVLWVDGEPCLSELELVEPELFFRHGPGSPARLAASLAEWLTECDTVDGQRTHS